MYDRLLKLLFTDVECDKDGHGDCSMCEYEYAEDECAKYLSTRIVDFLIASGVIAPPCKVGDTVYYINLYNHIMLYKHEVYEAEVVRLVVTRYGVSPVIRVKSVYSTYEIPGVEFGKNVFLTREEAEQVLAERKVL